MRILDRYIIRSFLVNYLLALGVLVGMYILLDLVVNFDNFTQSANAIVGPVRPTAWSVLADITDYYMYQFLIIFQQVSGVIPLLAAGFTMVRMTRHNELTAMLASGVSLYRVAAPIVLCSIVFSGLGILNQELLIPQPYVVAKLLRKHGEVSRPVTHSGPVYFVRDIDNSLLLARDYNPATMTLTGLRIIQRDETGAPIGRIMADSATWEIPPGKSGGNSQETGAAWVMKNVMLVDDRLNAPPSQRFAVPIPTQTYTTPITPQQLDLIFSKKAVEYLSSARIYELIQNSPDLTKPMLYKMMHIRFTQPLMNLIMLLIGIPFLLTREPNRLIVNMFYCTIVTGLVFAGTFVIFQMGGNLLDPLLAAWLPVLIFGPLAVVMLDTFHT
jgi:lipopolysaccharide export system permease protein